MVVVMKGAVWHFISVSSTLFLHIGGGGQAFTITLCTVC